MPETRAFIAGITVEHESGSRCVIYDEATGIRSVVCRFCGDERYTATDDGVALCDKLSDRTCRNCLGGTFLPSNR